MAKWWDRFWGALWVVGSAWIAYKTAQWFSLNAAPRDLGVMRYLLIAFAFLFGLLLGMGGLSLAIIAVTVGLERLFGRLGYPLRLEARSAERGTRNGEPGSGNEESGAGDAELGTRNEDEALRSAD